MASRMSSLSRFLQQVELLNEYKHGQGLKLKMSLESGGGIHALIYVLNLKVLSLIEGVMMT